VPAHPVPARAISVGGMPDFQTRLDGAMKMIQSEESMKAQLGLKWVKNLCGAEVEGELDVIYSALRNGELDADSARELIEVRFCSHAHALAYTFCCRTRCLHVCTID